MTKQIDLNDTRQLFMESWIKESPMRTSPRNDFNVLVSEINEFTPYGSTEETSPGIFVLTTGTKIIVYAKTDDNITAVIATEKTPQSLVVYSTAKHPSSQGKPPYMSDLYLTALDKATGQSIRFSSDKTLTDAGYDVWERLLRSGATISVYDKTKPGQSLVKIQSIDDLKKYWDYPKEFSNYQYVLSESIDCWVNDVFTHFSTRRLRELANITLDENYL